MIVIDLDEPGFASLVAVFLGMEGCGSCRRGRTYYLLYVLACCSGFRYLLIGSSANGRGHYLQEYEVSVLGRGHSRLEA